MNMTLIYLPQSPTHGSAKYFQLLPVHVQVQSSCLSSTIKHRFNSAGTAIHDVQQELAS